MITRVTESSSPDNSGSPIAAFNAVAGNTVLVFIRAAALAGRDVSSVTDTAGNTYTRLTSDTSHDPYMWVYAANNITGNAANVITVSFTSTNYCWSYAVQYSGTTGNESSGANAQAAATDQVSTGITTTGANRMVVMAASCGALNVYTAGTDFTLISGQIGSASEKFGGIEQYLAGGAMASYIAHITSSVSSAYTTIWVVLTPSATTGTLPLIGRGPGFALVGRGGLIG